jgi:hypothetical protein
MESGVVHCALKNPPRIPLFIQMDPVHNIPILGQFKLCPLNVSLLHVFRPDFYMHFYHNLTSYTSAVVGIQLEPVHLLTNLVQQEVPRGMTTKSAATSDPPRDTMVSACMYGLCFPFAYRNTLYNQHCPSLFHTTVYYCYLTSLINEIFIIFRTYIRICNMCRPIQIYISVYTLQFIPAGPIAQNFILTNLEFLISQTNPNNKI